jgi:hypothetical protein
MDTRHVAGYVYVATNALMPGLVKAGRTQTSVDDRLRSLYSTGVPCPFVAEKIRFFVDCFSAEASFFKTLESVGTRCGNREFFQVDPKVASELLEELYGRQHQPSKSGRFELDSADADAEETFRILHANGNFELAEQTVRTLLTLPYSRRHGIMLRLLAQVMEKGDERFSRWLISNFGVDPDLPIECTTNATAQLHYYLTALEYSIYLRLPALEHYLESIGCEIRSSSALCFVIDTLLNRKSNYNKNAVVQFGVQLLIRGINADRILDLDTFIEAPRASYLDSPFHFDVFPRNCNLSCREIIAKMALCNPLFAPLHQTIVTLSD